MLLRNRFVSIWSIGHWRNGLNLLNSTEVFLPVAQSTGHRNTWTRVGADGSGESETRSSALTVQGWCSTDSFRCKRTVFTLAPPSLSFQKCDLPNRAPQTPQARHYHAVSLLNWSYFPSRLVDGPAFERRWMSYKKKGGKRQMEEEEEDEELNAETEGDEDFGVEEDGPEGYKDKKVHLKSVRMDAIIASGLNMARNKAEEYFYSSKLRLNGEKVTKKSKQMAAGDYVDVIMETGETTLKVKRVKVLEIDPERTQNNKFVVKLRAWRSAFEVELPDERPF